MWHETGQEDFERLPWLLFVCMGLASSCMHDFHLIDLYALHKVEAIPCRVP